MHGWILVVEQICVGSALSLQYVLKQFAEVENPNSRSMALHFVSCIDLINWLVI